MKFLEHLYGIFTKLRTGSQHTVVNGTGLNVTVALAVNKSGLKMCAHGSQPYGCKVPYRPKPERTHQH